MSASPAPMVPDALYIQLMVLYGKPMLSRMLSSSSGGITRRIESSTRSTSRAVSSMRVPDLARTWRRIWPLSVLGKKSCPSQGTKRKAARQLSRNTGMKMKRRCTSVVSSRW